MSFIIAILLLGYANLVALVRALLRGDKTAAHLHYLALVPFAVAILSLLLSGDPRMRSVTSINWPVVALFAYGLGSAAIFGWKIALIYRQEGDASTGGWRSGLSIWVVVAGLYVVFAVVDHWWFFRDYQHSGMVNTSIVGADDVLCAGMVLVRLEDQEAVYRCPKSLIWGGMLSDQPFVPWPTYTEGRSASLKIGIESILARASQVSQQPEKE